MNIPTIKNKRLQILIPAGIFLIIFIIILLIVIPSSKDNVHIDTEMKDQEYDVVNINEASELNSLELTSDNEIIAFFNTYYDALASGDEAKIKELFDDPDHAVSSDAMASLIDGYQNLRVYIADGLHENEYAAFVYNDIKFKNIDTIAPSVDSFYISKGSGAYKIVSDMYYNEDIVGYLTLLSQKDPVRDVMSNTDAWLETSLANDEDLKNIYEQMKNVISDSGDR